MAASLPQYYSASFYLNYCFPFTLYCIFTELQTCCRDANKQPPHPNWLTSPQCHDNGLIRPSSTPDENKTVKTIKNLKAYLRVAPSCISWLANEDWGEPELLLHRCTNTQRDRQQTGGFYLGVHVLKFKMYTAQAKSALKRKPNMTAEVIYTGAKLPTQHQQVYPLSPS